MSVLYIVATPIGNLEDITLRALDTLRQVSLIAAEDTRRTKKLLNAYEIKTPLISYHEWSNEKRGEQIISRLAEGDVALVSDAGMPGIADPGFELTAAAITTGIKVIPVPGPSVVVTALAVSGLPADRFVYPGFLPRKKEQRKNLLKSLARESGSIVLLETPHRLQAALEDIQEVLGNRRLAVCRELTKLHEEVFRGSVSRALEHFTEPRGEFTLVIEGIVNQEKPQLTDDVENHLKDMKKSGMKAKDAIAEVVAKTGLSRKELYRSWLRLP